jgi:hypothetical protein
MAERVTSLFGGRIAAESPWSNAGTRLADTASFPLAKISECPFDVVNGYTIQPFGGNLA